MPSFPLRAQPTPVSVSPALSTLQPLSNSATPSSATGTILRMWLPQRFDPSSGSRSAELLNQRLLDYETTHPGLDVVVRIKTEDGETGLLNALSVTSMAAPDAMPDLIALSRPALEAAALKGLLHPIDGLTSIMDDPDLYAYARELGHFQNIGYGLPFAGDVMVLVRRPPLEPFASWQKILADQEPLAFPAGDPQGLVGLSLYVSAGGRLLDDQGLPVLDSEPLTRVLNLIESSISANVLLPSLVDLETEGQSYQAFRDGRVSLTVTWASNFNKSGSDFIEPQPGIGGTSYSFAKGWVWALAGSNLENQQVAIELAEYLLEDEFINDWISVTNFLPTRQTAEAGMNLVLESAHILPADEVLEVLGPLMQEALTRVLNGEQPEVVAGSVSEKLK